MFMIIVKIFYNIFTIIINIEEYKKPRNRVPVAGGGETIGCCCFGIDAAGVLAVDEACEVCCCC